MSSRTDVAPVTAQDPDLRAVEPPHPLVRWLGANGSWVLLLDIVLIAVFTFLSRDFVFFSVPSLQSTALAVSTGLILALALGTLLGAGVIDLSVGSNLVLSSVVGAFAMHKVAGPIAVKAEPGAQVTAVFVGLAACVLTGALFGLVNGFIIEVLDVNSFIATLGTLGVGTGAALLITDGGDLSGLPAQLQSNFAFVSPLGIPLPALVALAIAVALWALLRYTRFGLRTLAIGSSRVAAERAGINVRKQLITLVISAGAMAGLAGFFSLATFGSTTLSGHTNDALNAITAAVIGGVALAGGRVNVLGIVYGAVLAQVLQAGLVIVRVPSFWQLIAVGVVLIFAVALDRFNTKRKRDSSH
ncbi:ABC transporter permease [Amycolatopsis sp. NPDC049252]|uniref:ABC transporter permease n=1 Tax=Amycolatopsis sp. NPDC049252 TaxID=3363933 RepID=UPI00371B4F79